MKEANQKLPPNHMEEIGGLAKGKQAETGRSSRKNNSTKIILLF